MKFPAYPWAAASRGPAHFEELCPVCPRQALAVQLLGRHSGVAALVDSLCSLFSSLAVGWALGASTLLPGWRQKGPSPCR